MRPQHKKVLQPKAITYKQQGIALIIFALILLFASLAALLSYLDSNGLQAERDKKTAMALGQAKAALIGYAVSHATEPGTLPCPDTDNDGDGSNNVSGESCTAYIGHLPWKQLGLSPLRDGSGECLWYAISPILRNPLLASRASNPLNSTTSGTITLVDDSGAALPASVNPVLAVVIAPGTPVAGQSRTNTGNSYCPGDLTNANYLEMKSGINNATGNVAGVNYTFILGNASTSFNDRLIYITASEFYPSLRKRMVKELLGNVGVVPTGPVDYFNTNANYPCPATTITGNANCLNSTGFIPYNDAGVGLQYASLGAWLTNNGWFGLATYSYTNPTHVKVTVTDGTGSYSCDANSNVFTCS